MKVYLLCVLINMQAETFYKKCRPRSSVVNCTWYMKIIKGILDFYELLMAKQRIEILKISATLNLILQCNLLFVTSFQSMEFPNLIAMNCTFFLLQYLLLCCKAKAFWMWKLILHNWLRCNCNFLNHLYVNAKCLVKLICDAEQLKFLFLIFGLKITNMTTCGITINCCNQHCYMLYQSYTKNTLENWMSLIMELLRC